MSTLFFKNQYEFREWLDAYHESESELLVGFYKVGSGKPSMTWSESVDQALCFGWIDSTRRTIDAESYNIRFTPRKPGSVWSAINIAKVERLTKAGLMRPKGFEAFKKLQEGKSKIYSHEQRAANLEPKYEKEFRKNKAAWTFYESQPPSYRKLIAHWIMNAKQEKTRLSRLEKVIAESAKLLRIK